MANNDERITNRHQWKLKALDDAANLRNVVLTVARDFAAAIARPKRACGAKWTNELINSFPRNPWLH